jgi:hypothetical protein
MLPQMVEKTMNILCRSLKLNTSVVESVYLYGSVALGNFIEGSSDIDFLAILRHPPSKEDILAISSAHEKVEADIPSTDIMGAYVLVNELGKPPHEMSSLLTYYNKQLYDDGTGADINPITWWILKNHGIRVYGSELSFNFHLEANSLVKYVMENLNTYWVGWIVRLENQLTLNNDSNHESVTKQLDEAVEWCALGMLRQLYTVKECDIKSKIDAGFYGIQIIPQQWHRLVHEAINIKQLRPDRFYSNNVERLTDLVALLRYIHFEANCMFDSQRFD